MFSKLLAVAQTKVGAALVAAALVAGGGTAVAVTATHGGLPLLGSHLSGDATSTDHGGTPDGKSGDQAHHLSVEGILQSYTAPGGDCSSAASASSVTPGSISVLPQSESTASEGDSHSSTPEAEGTHAVSQPASPVSIQITCDTRINGEHASSLKDLATAAAAGHVRVQVQATQQSGAWVASKVTVEGSDSSGDSHEGQEPTETPGSHEGQEPTEVPGSGEHPEGTPSPEASGTPHSGD